MITHRFLTQSKIKGSKSKPPSTSLRNQRRCRRYLVKTTGLARHPLLPVNPQLHKYRLSSSRSTGLKLWAPPPPRKGVWIPRSTRRARNSNWKVQIMIPIMDFNSHLFLWCTKMYRVQLISLNHTKATTTLAKHPSPIRNSKFLKPLIRAHRKSTFKSSRRFSLEKQVKARWKLAKMVWKSTQYFKRTIKTKFSNLLEKYNSQDRLKTQRKPEPKTPLASTSRHQPQERGRWWTKSSAFARKRNSLWVIRSTCLLSRETSISINR